MSGLRERQREKRRKAIVQAAVGLFASQGYQRTTVEQIAMSAEVAATTVFNYFGTKQQIVLDIIRRDDEEGFAATLASLEQVADPVEAMTLIGVQSTLHTLNALPLSVWREVIPLLFSPGTPFFEAYQELNEVFRTEARIALQRLVARGLLSTRLDLETCIQVCMDISHMEMVRLIAQENPDLAGHERYIRAAITNLLAEN